MTINRQLPTSGQRRGFTSFQISGTALLSLGLTLDIDVTVLILEASSVGVLVFVSPPELDAVEEKFIDGLVYAGGNRSLEDWLSVIVV
jgi:hypothetical protein